MPVPSAISDLSTTPGLNSPSGSESPASIDDYLRTHAAFIRQVSDASVKTSGAQTIDGAKTFSSPIAGSITGNAATAGNVTGTVAIANGGTGQTTAAAAFNAIKQVANEMDTGVVQLSTIAEAQAFTAGKVIDGAKLAAALKGANQTLATNGYQKLPGGLIVQWGTTGSIPLTSSAAQTFPIAFPNAFLGIATSARTQGSTHYADTGSLTGFTLFNTSGVACVFSYIAIGY